MDINIEEFEKEFIKNAFEYFKLNGTYSGFNSQYQKNREYELLYEKYGVDRLSELLFIIEHGYINLCKICYNKVEFLGATKGHRTYCSHKCSTLDSEVLKENAKKANITRSETYRLNPPEPREKHEDICDHCGETHMVAISKHVKYCSKHKKKCINCENRHNNAGKCCSMKCTNEVKTKTYLANNNVTHNFQMKENRPNTIEFYLKKGFTIEEAIQKVKERQAVDHSKFTKEQFLKTGLGYNRCENINEFIDILIERIKNDNTRIFFKPFVVIEKFTNTYILEYYTIKQIYDFIYKKDKEVLVYKKVKTKLLPNYGYLSYTKKGELLRSSLECIFYNLLENNEIEYSIGKQYNNSTLLYDFYLPKYDIYIEIAGMMKIKEYREKMEFKHKNFNSYILETFEDMINFIENLKNNKL